MKRFLKIATGLLFLTPIAAAQNPDLALNPGSSYVDDNRLRGIDWGTQFNRTYVLVPNSPNASICAYVVNNNPTSAHSFTLTVFQSADSRVADFTNNQGRYNSVPLIGMPASVAAGVMVSGFTQSTAAAKVALKFTGAISQAGSPDTADVFFVQTTTGTCGSSSLAITIQGTTAPGLAATGNPVLIGGIDQSGNAQFETVCTSVGCSLTANLGRQPVGGATQSYSTTANVLTTATFIWPAGVNQGAIAVTPLMGLGDAATSAQFPVGSVPSNNRNTGACTQASGQGCPGLFAADSGYVARAGPTTITSTGQSLSLWSTAGGYNSSVQTCHVSLLIINNSGTTPTLDAYVQDSPDNANWDDRIHFAQATTGTSRQVAGLAGVSANETVHAPTSTTIAASTIVNGPIDQFGRVTFVLTGTTPNYTVTAWSNCK